MDQPLGMKYRNYQSFPLQEGLEGFVEQVWDPFADVILEHSLFNLPRSPQTYLSSESLSEICKEMLSRDDDMDSRGSDYLPSHWVHLQLAAPGTGKTRRLLNLLSSTWGFYILPPNLTENTANSGPFHPRREHASRDTITVMEDYPSEALNDTNACADALWPLLRARFKLLERLLITRSRDSSPALWLMLQTCREPNQLDVCDPAYRLFRLVPTLGGYDDWALCISALRESKPLQSCPSTTSPWIPIVYIFVFVLMNSRKSI